MLGNSVGFVDALNICVVPLAIYTLPASVPVNTRNSFACIKIFTWMMASMYTSRLQGNSGEAFNR